MWKDTMFSNNFCTEGDTKDFTQDTSFRHQQSFDVHWITCLLDVKDAYDLKGIISDTCFQYNY